MASATLGATITEHQLTKEEKFNQNNVFEFIPNDNIKPEEIVELTNIVRIGVSGEKIAEMSPGLQKHFTEVKK